MRAFQTQGSSTAVCASSAKVWIQFSVSALGFLFVFIVFPDHQPLRFLGKGHGISWNSQLQVKPRHQSRLIKT